MAVAFTAIIPLASIMARDGTAPCAPVACGAVVPACCGSCCTPMREVTRTVLVPVTCTREVTRCKLQRVTEMVPHTRTVCEWVTTTEMVPRTRTVCDVQRVTEMVERTRIEYDRQILVEQEEYTVQRPVWTTEEREYTVMVPTQETRQGVRNVCVMESETRTRTMCVDEGQWVCREVPLTGFRLRLARRSSTCGCLSCNPCDPIACEPVTMLDPCDPCSPSGCSACCPTRTVREWVPNVVTQEVEYECLVPTTVEEAYEYVVTVCVPETRTREVRLCSWEDETLTREVSRCVCVPREVTESVPVTRCEVVQREVTEMVPVTSGEMVRSEVTEMRCKSSFVRVPVTETVEYTRLQRQCVTELVPDRRARRTSRCTCGTSCSACTPVAATAGPLPALTVAPHVDVQVDAGVIESVPVE